MKMLRFLSVAIAAGLSCFPSLCATHRSLDAAPPEKVKVFIAFEKAPGRPEVLQIEAQGGRVKWAYKSVPVLAAEVPKTALKGIIKNPKVSFVEPDVEITLNDVELDNTWGVKKIGSETPHASGLKGTGVKVGVIDSGIDYLHPDLIDRYAGGYDFYNNDSDPYDDRGHGTHVAGTIGASDNGIGVVGVAPEVELYALKVFGPTGSGYFSDVVAAVEWCIDHDIQVTNNSYSSSSHPGATVEAVFARARDLGMIQVASAGNSGSGTDTVGYPGKFSSVIAVAATDSNDNRASFSSTGPSVELAAPGSSIRSTIVGGGYGNKSGTSMAAPHVAGAAALLYGIGAIDSNNNGLMSDEIRQLLSNTALDLGSEGQDSSYGNGRLDLELAVLANEPPVEEPPVEEPPVEEPPVEEPPVEEPPAEPSIIEIVAVQYSGYGGKNRDKHFDVTLIFLDEESVPAANVLVSVEISSSRGEQLNYSGWTNESGQVVFSVKNAGKSTWTTAVLDAVGDGAIWDGVSPVNGY